MWGTKPGEFQKHHCQPVTFKLHTFWRCWAESLERCSVSRTTHCKGSGAGLRLVCRTEPGLQERIGDQQNGGGKYESQYQSPLKQQEDRQLGPQHQEGLKTGGHRKTTGRGAWDSRLRCSPKGKTGSTPVQLNTPRIYDSSQSQKCVVYSPKKRGEDTGTLGH